MKNIVGIKSKYGHFVRLKPIYKGDDKQYVSTAYDKKTNNTISNYWSVNANKDNFEQCKGCFSHWD